MTLSVKSTRPLRGPPQIVPPRQGEGGQKCNRNLAACCSVGDWNKDGVPDCAVGDNECAMVFIVSGKDCSLISTYDAGVPGAGVALAHLGRLHTGDDRLAIGVGSKEGAIEDPHVLVLGVPSWKVLFRINKQ